MSTNVSLTTTDAQAPKVPTMPNNGVYDYNMKLAALTPTEKEHYLEMSSKIKMDDMSSISHYGSELSAVVASNGDTLLQTVKGNNSSEVVQMTNELLGQLQMIDIDELSPETNFKKVLRKLPIIKGWVKSLETIKTKYNTISKNVEEIAAKIGAAKVAAIRDNGTLESIYINNKSYVEHIRELIIAAKLRNEEITKEITRMQEDPLTYDTYQINDAVNFKNALEKRISDMITTEFILHQNLFQIRATQSNNIAIADKSDNIINHVIPVWKEQLVIAITMNNQKASIEAQNKITKATNDILRKNADLLKINSINVAKAAEQSVVSLDTLRHTTQSLVDTITEVQKIHIDAAKNRANTEATLLEFGKKLEAVINESAQQKRLN